MNEKLISSFKFNASLTADKNHAAASAIFDVIFHGNLDKWNMPQDNKWIAKYNKGLIILANEGLIKLIAQ